jgi:hypothetical protein
MPTAAFSSVATVATRTESQSALTFSGLIEQDP